MQHLSNKASMLKFQKLEHSWFHETLSIFGAHSGVSNFEDIYGSSEKDCISCADLNTNKPRAGLAPEYFPTSYGYSSEATSHNVKQVSVVYLPDTGTDFQQSLQTRPDEPFGEGKRIILSSTNSQLSDSPIGVLPTCQVFGNVSNVRVTGPFESTKEEYGTVSERGKRREGHGISFPYSLNFSPQTVDSTNQQFKQHVLQAQRLEGRVKESVQRNLKLKQKLMGLLTEQKRLAERQQLLVQEQWLARKQIKLLQGQKKDN
uniref:Uncharacterized protein n=1 Tax=Tetraselmis sp. GSL018 TaxID=582737 RepID=A0A061RUL3_9CHLO|mmetsp:Transcript_6159/g.14844  ORF Transcript_6159/g.14844 Transcript_6159/m.14844 type:complete len:260 (+) Transcript_6159:725-1504(+)|eukprot:CAMPEP_0177610590 /NCGR_PEP_ID=MMETSP0419_2-20121207/19872_1 /TAXON_ID=582737 /ORGANISM="Tetraselmis sp., Strain GSL018" /LENGTH=259 /DNA_ID=CAMNT_0019105929 /DNA_START=691 /DNA_END=1470 /DNA_ORIENTATION=-